MKLPPAFLPFLLSPVMLPLAAAGGQVRPEAVPVSAAAAAAVVPVQAPEALVPGWELTLFAAEPEIVNPIGVAVDRAGRVFVMESHTHLAGPDHAGPKTDRIRFFEDTDGDGRADQSRVFAEGFTAGMNLRFDPDGVLHMVHRNGVVRLEDRDGDGVCEKQAPLLTLETATVYPHNGLSSLVFTPDGFLYVGSGENFGAAYTATAADGSSVTRTPGGANLFRMRRDGSGLECHATGLWNPFALAADGAGRVIAADNDPDSRGPCRLLHIVEGGDYGCRFQYGRSGLHPFVSWNGELAGMLPMIAATGEAPAGLLDAGSARLGPGRGEGFLVTEWGESTVSWFRLAARGASFTGTREVVIRGDAGFRPVALAAAPDGAVYLTDWADREYPVHGRGRIWRLKSREAGKTPPGTGAPPVTEPELRRARLAGLSGAGDWPELRAALTDGDPWIAAAARTALGRPVFRENLLREAGSGNARLRLEALLALRGSGFPETGAGAGGTMKAGAEALLRAALTDPDGEVRRLAARWAAELRLKPLLPLVEKAFKDRDGGGGPPVTEDGFALWLAAVDLISRDGPPDAATMPASRDDLLLRLLGDPAVSPAVRAAAVPGLVNFKAPAVIRMLLRLGAEGDLRVRREAVRSLASAGGKAVAGLLRRIALDAGAPLPLRLEALNSLGPREDGEVLPLLPLLLTGEEGKADAAVAEETARALRTHVSRPEVRAALTEAAGKSGASEGLRAQAALALGMPPPAPRPQSDAEWISALTEPDVLGNPGRGRRVFFSAAAGCSACHAAEGRGAAAGPDLSRIGLTADREKLIRSILEPGREIGPLYVTRAVTLRDGTVLTGILSQEKDGNGNLTLAQPGGVGRSVPADQVVRVEELPVSLMPEALEESLTVEDFRDLVAWLMRLR